MARVTVEDCIERIPNRFDLVLTASQRARGILKGDLPTIERDNDKNPVIALREIAAETVDINGLNDGLVKKMQRLSAREEHDAAAEEAAVGEVDLSEMIGDYSEAEGEEAGMHVSTPEGETDPGFEDVDLSQMTGED
ncbi:MAG: DNA-directed RNA polymerase subunit omega [Bacteroidetes bacterium]|jgi:DNA-directed RNA polymerase subunit omega|nr:DNA-directed RNA polymerase subunit omega [Bacteroidota bacterium]